MRLGLLIAGVVLLLVGLWLLFLSYYLFFLALPTLIIGVVLAALGATLPKPVAAGWAAPPQIFGLMARMEQVERREAAIEEALRRIESRLAVPPAEVPPPQVTEPLPTPPVAATVSPVVPLPVSPPPSPAPSPAPPTAPKGMSRFELELGSKWFQRIGLLVLAVAFAFLLVIVLPQMAPEQIILVDFAAAIGLGLLGEYLYARRGLPDYGKGLVAGAFAIAYIGLWGGWFLYSLSGVPWPVVLGIVLVAHAAAALRYRSPALSVEVGLFYLGWIAWLRAIPGGPVLTPAGYAALLSVGALATLGLAYVQRHELAALVLAFAFNIVALVTASLLVPYGYIPVLSVGLVTVVLLALLRLRQVPSLPLEIRAITWGAGIVLTYGILIANALAVRGRGGIDDITIFVTFVTLTAAFTVSEVLAGERRVAEERWHTWAFAALMGGLTFPIPFLLSRGELALVVYPAVLLALILVRPTKGLAWFANVVYLALIVFAAISLADPPAQLAALWSIFFGAMALHAFLQERSGYRELARGLPTDLQVPFFAVALTGLTAQALPAGPVVGLYALVLPLAILINRRDLRGPAWRVASVVAAIGLAQAFAFHWAFVPHFAVAPTDRNLIAVYNVAVMVGLGVWIAYRRSVLALPRAAPREALYVSLPALAMLSGLLAQDSYVVAILAFLPPVVIAIAYMLDDAVTFNVAYFAFAAQAVFGVGIYLADPAEATLLLPVFAGALIALGFVLDLSRTRRTLATSIEVTGTASWFLAAPVAFGLEVQTTIAWAVAGGVAVGWGLWRSFALLRYVGFALFFAVLGKVFLFDIRGVPIEFRILGLIVVAISLLLISYGYARYRRKPALPT